MTRATLPISQKLIQLSKDERVRLFVGVTLTVIAVLMALMVLMNSNSTRLWAWFLLLAGVVNGILLASRVSINVK